MSKLLRCPSISDLVMYVSTLLHPQFQRLAFYSLLHNLRGCAEILYFDTPSFLSSTLMSKISMDKLMYKRATVGCTRKIHEDDSVVGWRIRHSLGELGIYDRGK